MNIKKWGTLASVMILAGACWAAEPAPAKPALDLAGVRLGMPLGKALDKLSAEHPQWSKAIADERESFIKDCPAIYTGGDASPVALAYSEGQGGVVHLAAKCSRSDSGAVEVAEIWLIVKMDIKSDGPAPEASAVWSSLARRHGDPSFYDVGYDGSFFGMWKLAEPDMGREQVLSARLVADHGGAPNVLALHLWRKPLSLSEPKLRTERTVSGFESPY